MRVLAILLTIVSFQLNAQVSMKCDEVGPRLSQSLIKHVRNYNIDSIKDKLRNWEDLCFENYPIKKTKNIFRLKEGGRAELKYSGPELIEMYEEAKRLDYSVKHNYNRSNPEFNGYLPVGGKFDNVLDSVAVELQKQYSKGSIEYVVLDLYQRKYDGFVSFAKSGRYKPLAETRKALLDSLYSAPDLALLGIGFGGIVSPNANVYPEGFTMNVKVFSLRRNKVSQSLAIDATISEPKTFQSFVKNGERYEMSTPSDVAVTYERGVEIFRKNHFVIRPYFAGGINIFSGSAKVDSSIVYTNIGGVVKSGVALDYNLISLDFYASQSLMPNWHYSRTNLGLSLTYYPFYNTFKREEIKKWR